MIRIFVLLAVPIALLAIVVGAILSLFGTIDGAQYGWYAGIVGTAASLVGLYGISKKLNQSDIESLDLASIERVRRAAEEIEKNEKKLEKIRKTLDGSEGELELFEARKQQLEIVARKASLKVFLEEQLRFKEEKILECIRDNQELRNSIQQSIDARTRLNALTAEISSLPDADIQLLQEIMKQERREQERREASEIFDAKEFAETPTKYVLYLISREMIRTIGKLHNFIR